MLAFANESSGPGAEKLTVQCHRYSWLDFVICLWCDGWMKEKHDFFESRAGALKTFAVLTFFEWSLDCRRIRGYEFILQIKVIIQGFHRRGKLLKSFRWHWDRAPGWSICPTPTPYTQGLALEKVEKEEKIRKESCRSELTNSYFLSGFFFLI